MAYVIYFKTSSSLPSDLSLLLVRTVSELNNHWYQPGFHTLPLRKLRPLHKSSQSSKSRDWAYESIFNILEGLEVSDIVGFVERNWCPILYQRVAHSSHQSRCLTLYLRVTHSQSYHFRAATWSHQAILLRWLSSEGTTAHNTKSSTNPDGHKCTCLHT